MPSGENRRFIAFRYSYHYYRKDFQCECPRGGWGDIFGRKGSARVFGSIDSILMALRDDHFGAGYDRFQIVDLQKMRIVLSGYQQELNEIIAKRRGKATVGSQK